jgi:hypothetical protein
MVIPSLPGSFANTPQKRCRELPANFQEIGSGSTAEGRQVTANPVLQAPGSTRFPTNTSNNHGMGKQLRRHRWKSWTGEALLPQGTAYDGKLYPGRVKTKASKGPIVVPEFVRPIIEAWKRIAPDTSPEALMFPTFGRKERKGQLVPYSSKNFLRMRIRPVAVRLSVPGRLVTFQVMRRTLGTDLQLQMSPRSMPIVSSTLERFRGASAMRCCAGFFMGKVCSSFGGPAHPIYRYLPSPANDPLIGTLLSS